MLMGFSWIWGFLFGLTGISALGTIFTIFNSVQGKSHNKTGVIYISFTVIVGNK